MTKEEDFSKYGNRFQESLVSLIFQDRAFSDQIREVLDISFLELKYLFSIVLLTWKNLSTGIISVNLVVVLNNPFSIIANVIKS